MNPFRSVGARLSVALFLVVLGALAIVYVIIVPSLERRLIDAKVSQLSKAAPSLLDAVNERDYVQWQTWADRAAPAANARLVVYTAECCPATLFVQADSNGYDSADVANDPIARRAAEKRRTVTGTVRRGGERFAEVAIARSPTGPVVLQSANLHDSLANVTLVERRLLLAGLLALLISVPIGYGLASVFGRRIRRLEGAVDRIAAGRFDQPVVDSGQDELGELARSVDEMRERLAQLDHARREFIANASHELRTPIFSLGGFLELLADEDLDEATRREFLATMREQVARLTKLATELLDLTRIDAGRLHVAQVPFDLDDVVRALTEEFGPVALAGGHPLDVESNRVTAVGDEERVLQIGRILVENALVHTPPGTPVEVATDLVDGNAVLRVSDEGRGIAPEHAAHVFERFYRVDGAVASGSGLGLAIARELAELMGGRIELSSARRPTVFTLVLPAGTREPALVTT